MEPDFQESPVAVYIHSPFCLSKCGYCSFYSEPFRREDLSLYLSRLETEISLYLDRFPRFKNPDTIYFGGGSPSLLTAAEISRICSFFSHSPATEITLELNPIQITPAWLKALNSSPVNRLTIGLQSLSDDTLRFLDRRHTAAKAAAAIGLLREYGYENFSLDLIYGIPGTSLEDLHRDLDGFIALEPRHISTYLLSLEEDCAWAHAEDPRYAATLALDEEFQAQSYELIRSRLLSAGFEQYEISNFARAGFASRHNMHYWLSNEYLGLGAGATGWLEQTRYSNPSPLASYYDCLQKAEIKPNPDEASEPVSDYIIMGLRLCRGISRRESLRALGIDLWEEKKSALARLAGLGLIRVDEEYIALEPKAYFVSNAVIGELI